MGDKQIAETTETEVDNSILPSTVIIIVLVVLAAIMVMVGIAFMLFKKTPEVQMQSSKGLSDVTGSKRRTRAISRNITKNNI